MRHFDNQINTGMNTEKRILDACCGSRMMWFDKHNSDAVYMDIRNCEFVACDGRKVNIDPDVIGDFRDIPFPDKTFKLVVMDPPHLNHLGNNSYTAQKYGKLFPSWEADLRRGFDECMRVLDDSGVLVFKWNEYQIPTSKIIEIFGREPLFGHRCGKQSRTHWMVYMK